MRARHERVTMKATGLENRVLPWPANPRVVGIWGAVLQRARAVMSHARASRTCESPFGLHFVNSLDDHMLTDIGLEADAVWRDTPRPAWPN